MVSHFVLFALASLATRALSFAIPVIDMDETAHAVGSWVAWSGGLLYTDFVNNKPPLLYAYYGAAQALLGPGLVPVRIVTTLVTVPLTALAASAFFRHDRRGLVAGLLYILYGVAFVGHDALSVNTEVLLLLPASWAVVAVRDREAAGRIGNLLVAGVLMGVACLFKLHAAIWLPALAWAVVAAPRGFEPALLTRRLTALAAGVALVPGLAWAYFAMRGGQHALLYWNVGNNLSYIDNDPLATEWIGRAAATLLPFVAVTAPLWWLSYWRRRVAGPGDVYRDTLVTSLLVLSLVAAILGLRFYPHYLIPAYWPLALAAAPAATALLFPMTRGGVRLLSYTALVLLAITASTAALYFDRVPGRRVYRETDPVFRRVAERLRGDACAAGGSLFVWGYAPIFYYEARLRPASRFVVLAQARLTGYVSGNFASLRHRGPDAPGVVPSHWDWLFDDLERSRATYILDTAPADIYRWNHYPVAEFPRLQRYLSDHYDLIDAVDRVDIYRRRGCEAAPAEYATARWPPF